MTGAVPPDGPYYDDLAVGDRFEGAPRVTLTDGLGAIHHAIVGGRLRLPFDPELAARVTGRKQALASPALVWDVAIGQSTEVTQRAIANLFYRGLLFRHAPAIGDILHTVTTVTGLRPAASKPGRSPRGLAVLRIETEDQLGRPVLDFHRCALLPARIDPPPAGGGELEPPSQRPSAADLALAATAWMLEPLREGAPGPHFAALAPGMRFAPAGGDVVSNAPELARLTMNLAAIHHDRTSGPGGERLVYGGHTVGLALAQITRALPGLVTVLGWEGCDHLGPVREGDTLHSDIEVTDCAPRAGGGGVVRLRALVRATTLGGETAPVLDWRLIGLFA